MKYLNILLIALLPFSAFAYDPHHDDFDGNSSISNTTTIETTQILNLDSSAVAASMAGGLHQFDSSTDDIQLSFSAATFDGEEAFSVGLAMRFNKKLLLSGAVNTESGGNVSGGVAVGLQF